jgi:uncharacterized metal-binding protein
MPCDSNTASKARVCAEGKRYVDRQLEGAPKVAVIACEGACVKGEVARVAANVLAYRLERDRAVRICLGDAMTADSGMRTLVERAPQVLAVEGCGLHCATEIMKTLAPDVRPTVVTASAMYTYDREKCFEIFDMPPDALAAHAQVVAERLQASHFGTQPETHPSCCGPSATGRRPECAGR